MTLKLLHGEYANSCAAAGEPVMGYDWFCRTYQRHVLVTGIASWGRAQGQADRGGRMVGADDAIG